MHRDKSNVSTVYPFFIQYGVQPAPANSVHASFAGGIATVIVFAETAELAKARAARHVAREKWEITEVMRVMLVQKQHLEHMDVVLKSVYRKAEQAGIAAAFDGWKKSAQ